MTLVNRVSLFFLAALAICLAGYSLLSYVLIRDYLYSQFDRQLQNSLNVLVAAIEVEPDGVKWQPSDHTITLGDEGDADEVRWVIADEHGNVVDQSQNLSSTSAAGQSLLDFARTGGSQALGGNAWRTLQQKLTAPQPKSGEERDADEFAELVATVGRTTAGLNADLWRLTALVCTLPVALWLVAATAGRSYCRRALAPLRAMASRARSMPEADFHLRLPASPQNDELTDLASAFNGLLDQLQRAFEQQRRFTGDAAHQLRTPLTVLRGEIDVALRRPRDAEEYQVVLATLRTQAKELQQIVETLLFLARAENNSPLPDQQVISLAEFIPAQLERWRADPRWTDIVVDVETDSLITVSPSLLAQAINNLVDNAIKYSPQGTPISISARMQDDLVTISVADEGMGIAAEDREQIFDPFFRSVQARQSGVQGTGLGLSLVARIAEVLGSRIEYQTRHPRGSRFTILLPSHQATKRDVISSQNTPLRARI